MVIPRVPAESRATLQADHFSVSRQTFLKPAVARDSVVRRACADTALEHAAEEQRIRDDRFGPDIRLRDIRESTLRPCPWHPEQGKDWRLLDRARRLPRRHAAHYSDLDPVDTCIGEYGNTWLARP